MISYSFLEYIHIVNSTILFGTGIGSAFYYFCANRTKNIAAIAFATRFVVLADWIFTTPAIIIQPLTGAALMHISGRELDELWLVWALSLYALAGLCWLPVVWIQIKMRDMAQDAMKNQTELPLRYWVYERWWIALGSIAFPAVLAIFYLMIEQPI